MRTRWTAIAMLAAACSQSPAALAQSGASIEGRIRNRANGAAVAGASVVLFASDDLLRKTVRYQAVTDASGAFHFSDATPGRYQVMIEKSGFVMFPKELVMVERRGSAVALEYAMAFGIAPRARLSGRVLDSQGAPAAHAHAALIRGPALSFATQTDSDGRFLFEQVDEGVYTLMAAPEMKEGNRDIATYLPASAATVSMDEQGARRLIIAGDARVEDLRLQTAPVVRVRGTVTDSNGRPAAHVRVKLMPVRKLPAHVALSFDSYFIAVGEGSGFGPEVARVDTSDDGAFEFAAVPHGEWRVVAEAGPEGPSGSAGVFVADGEVNGVRVVMRERVSLKGSAEWGIWCVSARLSCGSRSAQGAAALVWFRSGEGLEDSLRAAMVQADGTFEMEGVPSGSAFLQELPPLLNGKALTSVTTDLERRGEAVEAERGNPLKIRFAASFTEGGRVILSSDAPVDLSNDRLKMDDALAGSVHGMVENGGGAGVILIPENYAAGVLGTLVFCQPDGSFDALGLRSGTYRVASFRGIDMEALRDPDLFARAWLSETKVRVELGETASIELGAAKPWPEQ